MIRKLAITAALLAAFSGALSAAPVSFKELDFLVRMHTPEDEILGNIAQRRLLTPLDDATAKTLTAEGASAALIAKIKAGNYAISREAAAEIERQNADRSASIARENASEEAAYTERVRRQAEWKPDEMVKLFQGKLVRLENGNLRPYSSEELRKVQTFALYFSARWCGPCRNFTPKLIESYKRLKADHPDFELIFVSNDKSEAEMVKYMKEDGMPWPAVQIDQRDARIRQYAAASIPWLLLLNDSGTPLYQKKSGAGDAATFTWSDPYGTLDNLQTVLEGHLLNPALSQ